jgi:amino acid adenylation domain-containing protein
MNPSDIEDIYELSPLQQGLLFHSLYDGDADVYVNQRSFLIDGPLDPDALADAWKQAVGAHPALRTSFHWDGLDKPLQVVHRDVPVAISRHDWSGAGEERSQDQFVRLLADDLAAGFDPAVPPLQRLHLAKIGEHRYAFVWSHHLLLLDGWSVPIFINDVVRRYIHLTAGGPLPAPAPPYRDYIAWLQRQSLDAAREFWVSALAGHADTSPIAPLLSADPQRTEAGPLDERVVELTPAQEADLRSAAAHHGVTFNTLLHAAWALVLQRYSGAADVTFGCTSSARPAELPAVDRMVGLFTSTLPVRLTVPDDSDLGPWLREVQARYAAVRRYEYTPLAQIRKWVAAPGAQPLFHSLVIFDNFPLSIEFGGLEQRLSVRAVDAVEKTSEPLVLIVTPEPRFSLRLRYHRDRFTASSPGEILECFRAALTALATSERIAEVARALASATVSEESTATDGRGASVSFADCVRTLPELVERQARATPDAPAVLSDEGTVSYRELLAGARRVAAALATADSTPGRVIGVCAERSPDMVAAVLGVLLAGAAYLPLDPSLPTARLAFIVGDAGADVVLAPRAFAGLAREAGARQVLTLEDLPPAPEEFIPPVPREADAAYVTYTSGSTGQPKGALITHQAIVNRLLWMQDTFALTPSDRVLHKTPFGFDVSVWELFWPLMTGAAMVLAQPGGQQDAEYLTQVMARHAVTIAHFVPSMLALFLDELGISRLTPLRRIMCSGEQLPHPLAARFRALLPKVELHNLYGPTEAAVDVTWWDCSRPAPSGVVPIGHPIANTQAYVLDRRLMQAPGNVPGELYLGGVQLALGYLHRPALTATRFVAHPLAGPGGRLYRTGDRVRRLPDGSLEFLGRLDSQVKIRGNRVELGEIEQVLGQHPSVREAAVIVEDQGHGPQLVAYLTGTGADPQALREYLQHELPRYMLPDKFTILAAMPVNHNGKLDRAALPGLSIDSAPPAPAQLAAPATPREESVIEVFCDVLGVAEIDVTGSFFDLGGNSYDAVRAIRRIEGATVGLLGAYPSVRELAAALDEPGGTERSLVRMTGPGLAAHTLVCVPFGGGSAITYQPLARALSPGLALLAVSVPGHELGGESGLRPLEDVAAECAKEILKLPDGPVSVYGHCAGVAMAVELVRRLEAAGRPVERLFVAGSYPFYEMGRIGRVPQRALAALIRRGILRVSASTVGMTVGKRSAATDQAEMRYLRSVGGFSGTVDDDELVFMMRAFRHDVSEGSRYFSEHWPRRDGHEPLAAPITFIAGTDDPLTPHWDRRYRAWKRFGMGVELLTVPDGQHYFHQHQPEAVSEILAARCLAPLPEVN